MFNVSSLWLEHALPSSMSNGWYRTIRSLCQINAHTSTTINLAALCTQTIHQRCPQCIMLCPVGRTGSIPFTLSGTEI